MHHWCTSHPEEGTDRAHHVSCDMQASSSSNPNPPARAGRMPAATSSAGPSSRLRLPAEVRITAGCRRRAHSSAASSARGLHSRCYMNQDRVHTCTGCSTECARTHARTHARTRRFIGAAQVPISSSQHAQRTTCSGMCMRRTRDSSGRRPPRVLLQTRARVARDPRASRTGRRHRTLS